MSALLLTFLRTAGDSPRARLIARMSSLQHASARVLLSCASRLCDSVPGLYRRCSRDLVSGLRNVAPARPAPSTIVGAEECYISSWILHVCVCCWERATPTKTPTMFTTC